MANQICQIRSATKEDADFIYSIHTSAIQEICKQCYSDDEIRGWIGRLYPGKYLEFIEDQKQHVPAGQHVHFVVAECDGTVIGFGHLGKSTDEAYQRDREMEIKALYISPDKAGKGVGSALILHLEGLAKDVGCKKLIVKSSLNAVGFYESRGFSLQQKVCCHQSGLSTLKCRLMAKFLSD